MKFSNLFNKAKPLASARLYKAIDSIAFKILKDDNSIVKKSDWFKSSGHSNVTYDSYDLQNALFFERQILCLAGAWINDNSSKHNRSILKEVIIQLGKKNYNLRNWMVNGNKVQPDDFLDYIYSKYEFYLEELLKCFEMDNHSPSNILFHLYNPLSNLDYQPKDNQKMCEEYLNLRFKLVTFPVLINELPKLFTR